MSSDIFLGWGYEDVHEFCEWQRVPILLYLIIYTKLEDVNSAVGKHVVVANMLYTCSVINLLNRM